MNMKIAKRLGVGVGLAAVFVGVASHAEPPKLKVQVVTNEKVASAVKAFESAKTGIAAEKVAENDRHSAALKGFVYQHQAALTKGAAKVGLDTNALTLELKTIGEGKTAGACSNHPTGYLTPDLDACTAKAKQNALDAFVTKYGAAMHSAVAAAALDCTRERNALSGNMLLPSWTWTNGAMHGLSLSVAKQGLGYGGGAIGDPHPAAPPPPPPPSPQAYSATFSQPFSLLRQDGGKALSDGSLSVFAVASIAASSNTDASAGAVLHVEPGFSRVSISATLNVTAVQVMAVGVLGYGNAEATLELHVLEGTNLLCKDHASVDQQIAAGMGDSMSNAGTGNYSLHCEFTRAHANEPSDYSVFAQAGAWAAAGGPGAGDASEQATLQSIGVWVSP